MLKDKCKNAPFTASVKENLTFLINKVNKKFLLISLKAARKNKIKNKKIVRSKSQNITFPNIRVLTYNK